MKKLLAVLLMVATVATLGGCGSSETESESTGSVLRVGMECAYAPFNWTQETDQLANGETAIQIYDSEYYAYGYDVMMALMLAEEMGYDSVEIHKVEWDSLGLGLDAGDYDCIIAGMGKTAVREEVYDFTDTYYLRDNVLVVKADSELADITGVSEFAGLNVIGTTQIGTGWVDLMPQIPDIEAGANYSTTAECFMAVSNGVADVLMIDKPTAISALMTNTDLTILELDEEDGIVDESNMGNVCIAVTKGDTELVEALDAALDALEWDQDKMDELMDVAIELQPASN